MGFRTDFDESRARANSFGGAREVRADRKRRFQEIADQEIRAKKAIEGDFQDKLAQAREMQGTFQQHADQERAIQGTYDQRQRNESWEKGQDRKTEMDRAMLAYGPESTGAKQLEFDKQKWGEEFPWKQQVEEKEHGLRERAVSADEARAMAGNRSVVMMPQYAQDKSGEMVKVSEKPVIIDTQSGEQIKPKASGLSFRDFLSSGDNSASPAAATEQPAQNLSILDKVASGASNQAGLDRFVTPSAGAKPTTVIPTATTRKPERNLTVQEFIGMTGNALGQGFRDIARSAMPSMQRAQVNANTAYQMAGDPNANIENAKALWKKVKKVPYQIGEMSAPGTTYYGQ